MDLLVIQHSILIRRLRRKCPAVNVEELKQFFDNIIEFLKNLTYTNKNTDSLDILTLICDDLPTIHTLQLFDHPVLINHPIFIYIGRILEMLLIKSNHFKSIPMKLYEENCFDSISYLITQLCLHRNETIELFYGSISNEIFLVTGKINIRDETINENSRKSNPIAEKPNLKVSSLPPDAPKSRPIEETEFDITKIIKRKKFSNQLILSSDKTKTELLPPASLPTDLPSKKYQDIFLTKSFLAKLARAIEDLSQIEYSPYHIKYKVINRLVHLCSKLNIVDILLDPIVKCLRSKFYRQVFTTIETNQLRLNPQQLFFIYQCPQFIIQNEFQRQEQIPNLLCQTIIEVTKPIIDIILPNNDDDVDSTYYTDRGIALHALRCHLEFLNYFSLTSSGRRYFIQSYIIDQVLNILSHNVLLSNGCKNEELFYADVGIIAYALMLLYNLSYEKSIFSMLKRKDLQDIYSNLESSKDNTIQFALETLSTLLNDDEIDEENEPIKLKQTYIEYMQKLIIKSKQTVKLDVADYMKERKTNVKYNFLTGSFFEKLTSDIEDLSKTEYPPNILKYKDVSRRVRVCTKQGTDEVKSLLDPILKCLNSEFYLKVFDQIDFNQRKVASRVPLTTRSLLSKHLFFMRECPEFLFRHDHQRYDEIVDLLGKKMLGYTTTIFEKHLATLVGDQAKGDLDADKPARMEALSYHIKMLTHFTQTRSMRREFLRTSLLDQILLILQDQSLFDTHEHIADAKLGVVGQSLTLLYNLASEEEIYSKLKTQNILNICLKLRLSKDKIIHFTSQILSIMLNKDIYDDINKPDLLSKTCIEYIDKSVKEPNQLYQGIKLNGLLKNVKIIVQNDSFIENLVEDKGGIPAITKCAHIKPSEDSNLKTIKNIQKTAIDIVWRLSCYGPIISKKLKQNDLFIDRLLTLLNETSNKTKQVVDAIIWRLGSVETVRLEQTQKEVNRKERREDTTDDDQLPFTDEWDETIPYDLLISYSNNVSDKVLCLKIYSRLVKKGYRVYSEKQSKHRLELMQKAIAKRKPILVCLSKSYRLSKICMAEAGYADKQSCPIIPVIVETKFKIQGWLKHIVGGKIPIDFTTQKKFDEALLSLCVEIEELKSSD